MLSDTLTMWKANGTKFDWQCVLSVTENSTPILAAVVNVKNDARYSRHNSHLNWSY